MKPKVALIKSNDRSQNIEKALVLIEDEINVEGKRDVFIKVNFVSTERQLASTHVDAVRPLLKILRKHYDGKITIGESTLGPADAGFDRFGYRELVKEFGVELVDLDKEEWQMVDLYDSELKPMKLHFSQRIINSDYRIIVSQAKVHDTVGTTLSIKNLTMGGISFSHGDKKSMHQGYPAHNLNLYLLAAAYPPQLGIIDGFTGMEGQGPLSGNPVDWGVAVASRDTVAADSLAAQLMGFNISDIGYLWYCCQKKLGVCDMADMDILGADPKDCYHKFQPHPTYEEQKHWRDERVNKILNL